jgi:hypothetical protein
MSHALAATSGVQAMAGWRPQGSPPPTHTARATCMLGCRRHVFTRLDHPNPDVLQSTAWTAHPFFAHLVNSRAVVLRPSVYTSLKASN